MSVVSVVSAVVGIVMAVTAAHVLTVVNCQRGKALSKPLRKMASHRLRKQNLMRHDAMKNRLQHRKA